MNIKVSVCIPVYGVEKYIEKCARSLFEQTMREGIEFIFVNDCTKDRSIEILEQVLAEYPHRKEQTKIIHLPENGGVGKVRRIAIENCTGEYIIHCDSDDWVELDMYEKMYLAAKENNADMVYCDYIEELSNGNSEIYSGGISQTAENLICEFLERKTNWYLHNKMYRKEIARKDYSESCPDHISYMEDGLRNCAMLRHCNKLYHLPEALYHYNKQNPSSMVNSFSFESRKMIFEAVTILSDVFQEQKYQKALYFRQRQACWEAITTNHLTPQEWHSLWKKAKTGMWKDNHFSFKRKCIFYLACINYRLASHVYRKMKGIS